MEAFVFTMKFLGTLLRALGLLVFGLAGGWFTLHAFEREDAPWSLQVAVYLGFFAFTALIARFTSPGGLGAFALGAAAALLYWGAFARSREG